MRVSRGEYWRKKASTTRLRPLLSIACIREYRALRRPSVRSDPDLRDSVFRRRTRLNRIGHLDSFFPDFGNHTARSLLGPCKRAAHPARLPAKILVAAR